MSDMFRMTLSARRTKKASVLALAFLLVLPGILAPFKQVKAASCVLQGNTITVDCEFAPDTYYYTGTLTIDPLVTVTAGSQSSPGIVYIYADDIVVNGTISANGMGSAGGAGTCPGSSGTTAGGGCHAGFGGRSSGNVAGGTAGYGFAELPSNVGSGGGDDTSVGGQQGGRGGGAVWLGTYSATGTLSFGVSGAITANGENGVSNEAGGGSGGAIYLDVGILDVQDGVIQANGGNGSGSGANGGGGGGGGMIAIRFDDTTGIFTQSRQAYGGNRGTTTSLAAQAGGPGTIYTNDLDADVQTLTVQNDKVDPAFTRTDMVNPVNTFNLLGGAKFIIDDQLEVDDDFTYTGFGVSRPELWIRSGYFTPPDEAMTFSGLNIHQTGHMFGLKYMTFDNGVYSVDPSSALFGGSGNRLESLVLSGTGTTTFSATGTGTFYVDTFQAKSNSFVTHATNTTATTHSLNISATTSLEVQSGASVTSVGRGFNLQTGTGAATSCSFDACGGGSHGGNGGTGSFGTPGLTAYGNLRQPTTLGSGGGGSAAGKGGGIIKLVSGGAMTIAGTVSSNGASGVSHSGGGAGGSVWIDAGDLAVSGTISANGGAGGSGSGHSTGGGGGGRVAIYYDTDSGGGTRSAYGGSGIVAGTTGGAGTVFTDDKNDGLPNGNLIIDANNSSNARDTQQICTPDCVHAYDAVTVRNGSRYVINAYTTLALASGGTLTGGGTQQPRITVNAGGAFTPTGATSFTFDDLDVTTSGTMNVVTDLAVANATYTESGTGTYSAGVTDLTLNAATYTKATGFTGLDLTDLTVPNGSTFNNNSSAYYPFLPTFDTLTVYGTYSAGTTQRLFLDELIVQNGGTVTHAAETDGTQSVALDISATTSIYVHAGGSITAASRGFPTATGPGASSTCAFGACRGASHAGLGGAGSFGSGGTTTYGSVTEPTTLGSGGGNDTGVAGGLGGGAIRLAAAQLTAAGSISANGGNGPSAGGGGAGGSVWIDVGAITGGGSITANGGTGGTASGQSTGGGGGGRVAIHYGTDSATGTRTAHAGTDGGNGTSGGAGSVFTDDTDDASPYGDLKVDNNNISNGSNTNQECLPDCAQTYANITIARGAKYVIAASRSLTLAAGGTLTGGGTTRPTITVSNGGTFDPGIAAFSFNALDISLAGTLGSATTVTVSGANLTLSGTGTFANPVTALHLQGFSSFTQGSAAPNLDLTTLDIPTLGTVTHAANAYYPFGPDFATLNVTGTYVANVMTALFVDSMTVMSGGLVTHATNVSTTAQDKQVVISATGTITVAAGGSISAAGKGFAGAASGIAEAGKGPGGGTTSSAGAGHGGNGGFGSVTTHSAAVYGSATQPGTIGSGGGSFSVGGFAGPGGNGGGAIKLVAGGTMTLVGSVSAAGGNGANFYGGGSGGSLWLQAGTLTGGGAISVNGGTGGSSTSGGGGGGRLALYYATDSGTGTRSAYGGIDGGTGQRGGAGTIFLDDTDDADPNGTLIIDNNDISGAATTQTNGALQTYDDIIIREASNFVVPNGSTLSLGSGGSLTGSGTTRGTLTINAGGTYSPADATTSATGLNVTNNGSIAVVTDFSYSNGTFAHNGAFTAGLVSLTVQAGANWRQIVSSQLFSGSDLTIEDGGTFTQEHTNVIEVDAVTIESGGTLTHCDNSTAKTCQVNFDTTTFTIEAGGTINVDAKGFDSTTGDGQGGDAQAGGGAGYGGDGGDGVVSSVSQNNNGALYGSATGPVDLGSGGGDDTGATNQQGGAGGGVIRLNVAGTLTVAGAISADGQAGTANEGGGGSGGSIWLTADAVTATATIGADGGAGSGNNTTGGGCGAGGRVAVGYISYSQSATTTAAAGSGCTGVRVAETGSVYLYQTGSPPVNGFTRILPTNPEVGQNVVVSASATDDIGVVSIEIYLDGTDPANLVKTCSFSPAQTPATCQYEAGSLSAGSHAFTVVSEDTDGITDSDTSDFSIANRTSSNRMELGSYEAGETTTFSLSFTLSATSTGTLTVAFPSEFTVNSAASSGSACLSGFGFTSSTLTATKTGCAGTVSISGASVTNPAAVGTYTITFTNDNGSGIVTIVDDDDFDISASVDPILTFNVGTTAGACDGTFTGNGGTLALGSLTVSAVATSGTGGVAHICARLSTNAPNGAVVTVRSQNASLASVSSPGDTIPSSGATLAAGTAGYGLCVGDGGSDTGRDATTPVGASPVRAGPFGGACSTSSHQVGGLTTSAQTLWSVADPSQNAFARIFVKAAIGLTTQPHNDYSDVLTFIATGTY